MYLHFGFPWLTFVASIHLDVVMSSRIDQMNEAAAVQTRNFRGRLDFAEAVGQGVFWGSVDALQLETTEI